ncbi:MAG: glycosyltransferase family 2 protein [Rhodospirillaceae bacterium]|nr:MAG: glycosyltransferase family 2 protein [Rhodospirillaceae bacterium]
MRSVSPFFSVLIAVHNRHDFLVRALMSVINQVEHDYEVVLVDDGSTDGTFDVAERFFKTNNIDARTLRLPKNVGIPRARNACLSMASGAIAAFLDSDDIWHPRHLSLLRPAFSQSKQPVFVFTDYFSEGPSFSGPVRHFRKPPTELDPIVRMITEPFVHTMSCFAAPMSAIRSVGGFTERLSRFSDLDLYVRLLAGPDDAGTLAWREQPIVNIPQISVLKTIHLFDRDIDDYQCAWEKGKRDFLDQIFAYPCLRDRSALRQQCEAALLAGQKRLFANFPRAASS